MEETGIDGFKSLGSYLLWRGDERGRSRQSVHGCHCMVYPWRADNTETEGMAVMAEEYSMEEEGGKNAGSMCWTQASVPACHTSNFSPVCCRATEKTRRSQSKEQGVIRSIGNLG